MGQKLIILIIMKLIKEIHLCTHLIANIVHTSGGDDGDELLIFTSKCNPVKSYVYSLEDVNVKTTD